MYTSMLCEKVYIIKQQLVPIMTFDMQRVDDVTFLKSKFIECGLFETTKTLT